jgi:hypothetical protein
MQTNKPVLKNQGHSSSMQTPDYALDPLVPFLKEGWVLWDCASGKGNIQNGLVNRGFLCAGSDIIYSPYQDFLTSKITDDWISFSHISCIVTNPPYNIKDKFLQHAYELGIPFAFLLPIESLGGARRQEMYRKYGLEVILFPFRVNFETPNGGSSAWFPVGWFTYGLNIGKPLTFVEDTRERKSS